MLKILNGQKVAGEILEKNAVEFKANRKWNNQNAWPFWYSLIPKPYLNTDEERGGLGLLGFTIPAGEIRDIPVVTAQDTQYRFINTKLSVYECYGDIANNPLSGTISLNVNSATVTGVGTQFLNEVDIGQGITFLDGSGNEVHVNIKNITSATILELDNPSSVTVAGANFSITYKRWFNKDLPAIKSNLSDLTDVLTNQVSAPGNISIPASGTGVTGVSTSMNSGDNALAVGDVIEYPLDGATLENGVITEDNNFLNTVAAPPASDTSVTVTLANPSLTTSKPYKRIGRVKTGTITVTSATGVVVGVGTTFTADVSVGDTIFYVAGGAVVNAIVIEITDNLNMNVLVTEELSAVAGGTYAVQIQSAINPSLPLVTFQNRYESLTRYIKTSLYIPSLRARFYYGEKERIDLGAIQTEYSGAGTLRTESLVPNEGILVFRFENTFDKPLVINGTLFGYKIALDIDG